MSKLSLKLFGLGNTSDHLVSISRWFVDVLLAGLVQLLLCLNKDVGCHLGINGIIVEFAELVGLSIHFFLTYQ